VDFFVGNMLALQVRYYFFALLIKWEMSLMTKTK
jgi:hypothetical protein